MSKNIGIIGAGVVGTAIGVVLQNKGYEITGVYDKKIESTKALVERIGCTTFISAQELSCLVDILFITTPDSAIKAVADKLATENAFTAGQLVIHMSGAHSSELLDKAREQGARVLSLHPLQSFANVETAIKNLPGSMFSLEGDADAYPLGIEIIENLGGNYFFIDRQAKPLYHAGACVVSNYLVTVIDLGIKLLEKTGLPREMAVASLMPLINGTISNIESSGIPEALTGPVSRGDLDTVYNHLICMEKIEPGLLNLYSCLGYYTAEVAYAKGTIDGEQKKEFQQLFNKSGTAVHSTK